MPGYWCWYCNQPRTDCAPGTESGSCRLVETEAADYRAEAAARGKTVNFGSVPGGSTETAGLMDHTRKFDRDMHLYHEARRAGEQPDQVSEEAIWKERKRRAVEEKVRREHGED